MKKISSIDPTFFQCLYSSIFLILVIGAMLSLFSHYNKYVLIILLGNLAFNLPLEYYILMRIYNVYIDDNNIYIKNIFQKKTIERSALEDINFFFPSFWYRLKVKNTRKIIFAADLKGSIRSSISGSEDEFAATLFKEIKK